MFPGVAISAHLLQQHPSANAQWNGISRLDLGIKPEGSLS
jgi:hypothetical protein